MKARSLRLGGLYETVHAVMMNGEKSAPRGQETRELTGFTLRIEDPADSLLNSEVRPKYSTGIAAAEAAQLVGGVANPELMFRVSPKFRYFANSGSLLGAYGPRVRSQLPEIINRLHSDRDSRQCVVTLWRPQDDLWSTGVKDIPCTVSFQFFLREDQLRMHTYMRSNDCWLGLTYDVFQFTQLQMTLANVLGVEYGEYVHTAGSMHIYERDFEAVDQIAHARTLPDQPDRYVMGFGRGEFGEGSIHQAMQDAADVVHGEDRRARATDDSTDWYWEILERYRATA